MKCHDAHHASKDGVYVDDGKSNHSSNSDDDDDDDDFDIHHQERHPNWIGGIIICHETSSTATRE
jgi:hypothetical protein